MTYPGKTAIGDAGEFFAAYKIAKELRWPCRLFDIDIGIDGQVEIMAGEKSTGRFVAIQVKTTTAEEKDCCYVKAHHFDYWVSAEIPVFVVLVDLLKEQMFLHLIDPRRKYERTSEGTYKIYFDLSTDLFTPESGTVMVKASERSAEFHVLRDYNRTEEAKQQLFESAWEVEGGESA
ncbi:DUF4365 domain-containing protein [Cupriavidus basilensis]